MVASDSIIGRLGVTSQEIQRVCTRWDIQELAVFGSCTGVAFDTASDVDVLVRFSPLRVPRLSELIDLRHDLQQLFHRPVDVITSGTIDAAPADRFSKSVMESRRVLYAA